MSRTTVPVHSSDSASAAFRSSGIGRNTAINVVGAILPLILALATVPAYLHLIGATRYGVLAIVWVVLGYFANFDLGLSRATANQIARMKHEPPASREKVFWTALSLNATVGAIGGMLLLLFGNLVVEHIAKVSPPLRSEIVSALPWLAVAVPMTTATLVLAGTLEGRERFLAVNVLSTAGLAMYQLSPLAYAYWVGPGLAGLIMSATLALVASTVLSFIVTAWALPVSGLPRFDASRLGALFRYGGWIAVSGLIGPILTLVDRIVIGAVLGARAVALYTIPYSLVARVQILPSSLSRTLFPRFSMLDRGDALAIGRNSVATLIAIMTPLTILGTVLLEPFLRIWIGTTLTRSSAPVGEILLLGAWTNSLAFVPYAFLQAQGRPDLPAKFHLLEVGPYIAGLILGLHLGGISGAAWAWTGRAALDAILLFWGAKAISSSVGLAGLQAVESGLFVTVSCLASLTLFASYPALRTVLGLPLILLSIWWGWRMTPPTVRRTILAYASLRKRPVV
jgi:O-antigen/teichoic acid export membrane protein